MKWHITVNGLEGLTVGDITPEKSVEWWETKKVIRRNRGLKELSDFLKHERQVVNTVFTRGILGPLGEEYDKCFYIDKKTGQRSFYWRLRRIKEV